MLVACGLMRDSDSDAIGLMMAAICAKYLSRPLVSKGTPKAQVLGLD
jgi:hypothetical protein